VRALEVVAAPVANAKIPGSLMNFEHQVALDISNFATASCSRKIRITAENFPISKSPPTKNSGVSGTL